MKDTAFNRFIKRRELSLRRLIISILSRQSQKTASLPLDLPVSPRILFLRQDRLGDAIITTPLLLAIQEKYPTANLMMLLGKNNKGIAPLLPIRLEIFIYRKNIFHDIRMLRSLRAQRIDVLIDMMDNASATSSIIATMIGARYTIGIEKENATSYNILVPRIDRGRYHIARRIAELVRPFGIDPEGIDLKPTLSITRNNVVRGRVGINISGGIIARSIPAEVGSAITKAIVGCEGVQEVLIFADPKRKELQNIIVHAANDACVKPAEITHSFADFASQIARCEYLLSTDTSALHLASALGIPVVGLYLTHSPEEHYWTPLGVPYEMVIKRSLSDLTSDEVVRAFEALQSKVGTKKELVLEEAL